MVFSWFQSTECPLFRTSASILSPWLSSIPSEPSYVQRVWLRQEPAQFIYHQICCHSQDEDEAWQSSFFHLRTYCGTVYHLNFGSSTVVLHFVDGWSHISFNYLFTNYFINFYNAPLFLSIVYVNGALQIIVIVIILTFFAYLTLLIPYPISIRDPWNSRIFRMIESVSSVCCVESYRL